MNFVVAALIIVDHLKKKSGSEATSAQKAFKFGGMHYKDYKLF